MGLTREDMLRELELLPMWHLRNPPAMPVVEAIAESAPAQPTMVESTVSETTATDQAAPSPADSVSVQADALERTGIATAPMTVDLTQQADEESLVAPDSVTQAVMVDSPLPVEVAVTIHTPWMLYCPQAEDDDSQQLLQNMLKAMQLPEGQYTLVQQAVSLAQTRTQYAVLYGLGAANAFLGTDYTDMAEVRGRVHQCADTQVVITHHPHALLAEPALKKETWFDLCLLLAKKA